MPRHRYLAKWLLRREDLGLSQSIGNVWLSEDEKRALAELSRVSGTPQWVLVRLAIRNMLELDGLL